MYFLKSFFITVQLCVVWSAASKTCRQQLAKSCSHHCSSSPSFLFLLERPTHSLSLKDIGQINSIQESLWQFTLIWSSESASARRRETVCLWICLWVRLHHGSLRRLPLLQSACGDKEMMKAWDWACVCVCACVRMHVCLCTCLFVTWACCWLLLDEGRGFETIGPKMSSSSLIGAAVPEPFSPPSGASERERERESLNM